jgi:hypothetical protein
MKLYMFRTVTLSIIWRTIHPDPAQKLSTNLHECIIAECTMNNSWWWTEELWLFWLVFLVATIQYRTYSAWYFFPILTQFEFYRYNCGTISQFKISQKSFNWETGCFARTCKLSDRHDEANGIFPRDCANGSKFSGILLRYSCRD